MRLSDSLALDSAYYTDASAAARRDCCYSNNFVTSSSFAVIAAFSPNSSCTRTGAVPHATCSCTLCTLSPSCNGPLERPPSSTLACTDETKPPQIREPVDTTDTKGNQDLCIPAAAGVEERPHRIQYQPEVYRHKMEKQPCTVLQFGIRASSTRRMQLNSLASIPPSRGDQQ